jgi:hypothetical protein
MRRIQLLASVSFILSGCATLSFAPPIVDMRDKLEAHRNQTTFNAVCTPQYVMGGDGQHLMIDQNVDGALALIDNYILTYRCQRDRASEGRQYFDLPSFLSLGGGAAAAAFGAPAAIAIGTGAASAAFGSGKRYYSPVEKSKVLSDGITAMLCIHNEAVGIDGPTLEAISQVQDTSGALPDPPKGKGAGSGAHDEDTPLGAAVSVTAERQYFNMVSTALWSVEQLMADRLRDYGKEFDMSGVQAELDKLNQEVKDKEDKAPDPAALGQTITGAPGPASAPGEAKAESDSRSATFATAQKKATLIGDKRVGQTLIQLGVLKPKLDKCIVMAKV